MGQTPEEKKEGSGDVALTMAGGGGVSFAQKIDCSTPSGRRLETSWIECFFLSVNITFDSVKRDKAKTRRTLWRKNKTVLFLSKSFAYFNCRGCPILPRTRALPRLRPTPAWASSTPSCATDKVLGIGANQNRYSEVESRSSLIELGEIDILFYYRRGREVCSQNSSWVVMPSKVTITVNHS